MNGLVAEPFISLLTTSKVFDGGLLKPDHKIPQALEYHRVPQKIQLLLFFQFLKRILWLG